MARTHFVVRNQKIDGRALSFIADYRETVNGPKVGEQTFQCPVAATRAEQERLMAQAVRNEIVADDLVKAAVLLVPDNTILALTVADVPETAEQANIRVLTADLVLKLRRHREAQKAVVEGALLQADNQVTNRKDAFVLAFEALRNAAGSNLNNALAVLLQNA